MTSFIEITPYLYIPFVAWAIAQLIKFSLAIIKGDANIRYLYASGGMPSVHSAVVCSLATWALIDGGTNSPLFGITAAFAAIVMYDSFGVRRSSGDQARTLNRLITDLTSQGNLKNYNEYSRLREILGHKPLEVIVGSLLGIAIACAFGVNKVIKSWPFLIQYPSLLQTKWLLIISGGILVISAILFWLSFKKYKNNKNLRSNIMFLAYGELIFGIILAISSFLAFEQIYIFISQWWFLLLATIVYILFSLTFKMNIFKYMKLSSPNADEIRKSKWLDKSKNKKTKKKNRK